MIAEPVRILILGAGRMAAAHARAYGAIDGALVVAVADTSIDLGRAFAAEFGIDRTFDSLGSALDWGAFDAVSNATPDPAHYPTTMQILKAGKAVLCEKPLATRHDHAVEMETAAAQAGVTAMVNLSYREVPAMREAARLVAQGALGDLRHFEASYLQSWLTQPAWGDWRTDPTWLWRLSTAHGSTGVLGDVGVHIVDFVTHVAGQDITALSCRLETFDKAPGGEVGAYALDANDSFALVARLSGGAMGTVSASRFASGHLNDLRLRLYGTKAGIEVGVENGQSHLRMSDGADLQTGRWWQLPTPSVASNYRVFVDAIRRGQGGSPSFADGAAAQRVLDAALRSNQQASRMLELGTVD